MTKSMIEQELDKLQEQGTWYKYYTKNKDLFLILQKAREELRKLAECNRGYPHICSKHPEDCDLTLMWVDVEKVLGK